MVEDIENMKSLWEERTSMLFDLIDIVKKGKETDDLIADLKENSEDIASATCGVFKRDSETKKEDPEKYYYELIKKNHPINGVKLDPDEDVWIRNYTSVSMLKLILKENAGIFKEYLKCTKSNDIYGQKVADENLTSNIMSLSGFLKSLSSTFDIETLNSKLIEYVRQLKKQADILCGAEIPSMLLEKEIKTSEEISKIIYNGMSEWKPE